MLTMARAEGRMSEMNSFLQYCRNYWVDWMRGQVPPNGWETRHEVDRDQWHETILLYERDEAIQRDLEYLTEAAFVFYTKHLDKFIRENDKLWRDFCRRRVDSTGFPLDELELSTRRYDRTIPGTQVPMNKKTVIPEPENHFSFSTKLLLMGIDLYEEDAPSNSSILQHSVSRSSDSL